ncbi:MAG: ribonuclease HI family protein, partial [Deltaproteobacteria bacterium]|nr:ribonuclease HI family protein [Deltaproteobacteria bacterium]
AAPADAPPNVSDDPGGPPDFSDPPKNDPGNTESARIIPESGNIPEANAPAAFPGDPFGTDVFSDEPPDSPVGDDSSDEPDEEFARPDFWDPPFFALPAKNDPAAVKADPAPETPKKKKKPAANAPAESPANSDPAPETPKKKKKPKANAPAASPADSPSSAEAPNNAVLDNHPGLLPPRMMTKEPKRSTGKRYKLYADGSSLNNPGNAGCGAVLLDPDGETIFVYGVCLGEATSNAAEYHALILGVHRAVELGVKAADIQMDSELVVKQVNGVCATKNPGLREYRAKALKALGGLEDFTLTHTPRENNGLADAMAKKTATLGKEGKMKRWDELWDRKPPRSKIPREPD